MAWMLEGVGEEEQALQQKQNIIWFFYNFVELKELRISKTWIFNEMGVNLIIFQLQIEFWNILSNWNSFVCSDSFCFGEVGKAWPILPGVDFTNVLRAAFNHADAKSAKWLLAVWLYFCAFGICTCKRCS